MLFSVMFPFCSCAFHVFGVHSANGVSVSRAYRVKALYVGEMHIMIFFWNLARGHYTGSSTINVSMEESEQNNTRTTVQYARRRY